MASIYWRNGIAWARAARDGHEFRVSLKTKDRKVARERLRAWLEKIDNASFGIKEQHTFDEAAAKFIDEHLPTIKKRSADRYMVSIVNLMKTFEGMGLAAIGSAALNDFVSRRRKDQVPLPPLSRSLRNRNRHITASTVQRDLHCLLSIFGKAIKWEWIDANPVGPFLKRMKRRGLRESSARTRYLSHAEEAALLATAAPYVADAIRFAIDTGLRKEEQFSREWSHIDLERREVTVHGSTSKNAKDRRVPILPRTRDVLLGLRRSDKLNAVFWHNNRGRQDSPRKARRLEPRRYLHMDRGLKAAAKRAGVDDVRWHDLRRTCGCRLLQDHDMSMETVSKWLGHSSIAVTERSYAFLGIDHLHRAVKRSEAQAIEPPTIDEIAHAGGHIEVL